jgi:hypothetical protein
VVLAVLLIATPLATVLVVEVLQFFVQQIQLVLPLQHLVVAVEALLVAVAQDLLVLAVVLEQQEY